MITSTLWTDTASAARPATNVDYGEPERCVAGAEDSEASVVQAAEICLSKDLPAA